MPNISSLSMHGDGIRFDFFHHLWNKNKNKIGGKGIELGSQNEFSNSAETAYQVRLPDTVIFRLGQPLQWYFTSERGKRASILRKRKRNVKVEHIEEVFLRKCKSKKKGPLDSTDIVAYFIASGECTHRNHQGTISVEQNNCSSPCQYSMKDENACNIEYFNEEGLHDFLYKRKDHQTGILQRFIDPAGGGKQNSQIRAICTPKMCVLERRKTKQDLHDARFGLYERAVTFEGPEVYSTSLPIRGAALPGRLKGLCQRVLSNISEATSSMNRTKEEDLRMVLNLKLDSKEKIWLLYSSSVRFVPRATKFLADVPSHEMTAKGAESLNIEEVIKLSPSIKLTQNANHDPSFVISNKNTFNACPSCSNMKVRDNFQPVPYKTIISHYEKVMELSRNLPWPPHPDIIKSAGGVGFGSLKKRKVDDICDDDIVIPPVIRHLHPRLKVEGYRMFRTDPLFLHKTSQVCEECFLSYAKLVTTSFQINKPIQLHTEMRGLGFASSAIRGNLKSGLGQSKWKKLPSNIQTEKHMASSLLKDLFVQGPSLPPAIVDPPEIELEHDKKKFMPLPYHYIESTHQPLLHLIDAKKKLSKKRLKRDQQKPKLNPYEIPLCIVESDLRCTKATAKKMTRDTRDKGDEGTNTNTGQLSPAHNATNANDITTNSLTVNSSRMINDETIEMLSKMLDEM